MVCFDENGGLGTMLKFYGVFFHKVRERFYDISLRKYS